MRARLHPNRVMLMALLGLLVLALLGRGLWVAEQGQHGIPAPDAVNFMADGQQAMHEHAEDSHLTQEAHTYFHLLDAMETHTPVSYSGPATNILKSPLLTANVPSPLAPPPSRLLRPPRFTARS